MMNKFLTHKYRKKSVLNLVLLAVLVLAGMALQSRVSQFFPKLVEAYVIGTDCQQVTVTIPYGGDLGSVCNYLSPEFNGATCFSTLQACKDEQESFTGAECLAVDGVCRGKSGCYPDEVKSSSNIANIGCPTQPDGGSGICCVKSGLPLNCSQFTTAGSCVYPCLWQEVPGGDHQCVDMPNWPTPVPTNGVGGVVSPTPAVILQCQNGDQNRDQEYWLICECNNGCTYREDPASNNGGGWGWVCEENCRRVPIGTRPSTECNQIDYVHQGTSSYCGVAEINCPTTCRGGGGEPSPTPTTPVVTETPSGPQCINIAMTDIQGNELSGNADASFVPGETSVKFKCGSDKPAMVHHYEIRVTAPSLQQTTLSATNGTLSDQTYLLEESGTYRAECRICTTATTCHAYEYEDLPDQHF